MQNCFSILIQGRCGNLAVRPSGPKAVSLTYEYGGNGEGSSTTIFVWMQTTSKRILDKPFATQESPVSDVHGQSSAYKIGNRQNNVSASAMR